MKLQNKVISLAVPLILLLVGSCANINDLTKLSTPEPFSTQSIATDPVTQTQESPASPFSPSPEAVASLSVDEARSRLLDLLADNGECRLPCFWHITPGKSSFQDASAILMPLKGISEFSSFQPGLGTIDPEYIVEDDLKLKLNISFLTDLENQTVSSIRTSAGVLKREGNTATNIYDSPYFREYLNYYMLSNVLVQYGEPSAVMLSTMAKLPSSGVTGGFKILLLYPDQGILVNYTMQMELSDEDVIGCPANSQIELELHPSGMGDSFLDRLDGSGWLSIIQKTYKPIDEATSMTSEEFYQIFSQPTQECVKTPANLWPTPG